MPGAVDNDDFDVLNITKGMYAAHPSLIPDGYAFDLNNFVIRRGIVESRNRFHFKQEDQVSPKGYVSNSSAAIIGKPRMIPVNLPVASGNLVAAGIGSYLGGATGGCLVGIKSNDSDGSIYRCNLVASQYSGGLAVYNTTLYGATVIGVYKLNVSNYPTAITETAVASSPMGLAQLIVHKSRLFGWGTSIPNRLYFTDAPAVGALPDTWNTSVNFIDFNSPAGAVAIKHIVSLNNYIYVYTDRGLFSLYTQGGASNWTNKLLNANISIVNYNQVVSKNNLMYYIADEGIYVTDGFDYKNLSENLTEYFSGMWEGDGGDYCLGLFDGGLLVGVKRPQDSLGTDARMEFLYSKLDEIAWTKITFPQIGGTMSTATPHAFTSIEVYVQNLDNIASFVFVDHADTVSRFIIPYLYVHAIKLATLTSPLNYYVDVTATTSGSGVGIALAGSTSRQISCTMETRELFGPNFMRLKHFKELYMLLTSQFDFTVTASLFKDGETTAVPSGMMPSPGMGTQVVSSRMWKFGLAQGYFTSIRIRLVFVINDAQVFPTSNFLYESMLTLSQLGTISMLFGKAPLSGGAGIQ